MYGKIVDGEFVAANPVKGAERRDGRIVVVRYTDEELEAQGNKPVLHGTITNSKADKGMTLVWRYEDAGDAIVINGKWEVK